VANETPETISGEAAVRLRNDVEKARSDAEEARVALNDMRVRERLAREFSAQNRPDPYSLADRALPDFRGKEFGADDDVGKAAAEWYDQQAKLFAAPAPPEGDGSEQPLSEKPPASPFQTTTPNLSAPGEPAKHTPIVVGSKEFYESGWANKSYQDQLEAAQQGVLVTPEKVKVAQQDIGPFGARAAQ